MLLAGAVGLLVILLAICGELGIDWFDGVNSTYVLAPFVLLALACLFRLPRFMLPQWYKDWLDRGANKDELRKPEYSSPFTWLRGTPHDDQRKRRE